MALHAAAMMAFFMDQAQQAPIQIQCVQQAAPDSWVKWLLPTIVQTVISLASITAGVWIALWSFRKNRNAEHEHWFRDQKMAEWKEIHRCVAEVWGILHPILKKDELDLVTHGPLFQAVRKLRLPLSHTLFITCPFDDSKFRDKFDSFFLKIDQKGESVKDKIDYLRSPDAAEGGFLRPEEKSVMTSKVILIRAELIQQISDDFEEISKNLRELTVKDLQS